MITALECQPFSSHAWVAEAESRRSTPSRRPSRSSALAGVDVKWEDRRRTLRPDPDDEVSFHLYLRDVSRQSRLDSCEEADLWHRATLGCAAARERLACANLRLVVHIALRYRGSPLSVSDLISEGNLGLLRAVERFRPELGVRFGTYAALRIRARILRALSNQSRVVRFPAELIESLPRLWSTEARLYRDFNRQPTNGEIARADGLSLSRVRRLRLVERRQFVSLHQRLAANGEDFSLAESLPDTHADSPDEELAKRSDREFLETLLATLPRREERLLRLRYGLDDGRERSLEEVGCLLGLGRQRVQQIEAATLARLRTRARLRELALAARCGRVRTPTRERSTPSVKGAAADTPRRFRPRERM